MSSDYEEFDISLSCDPAKSAGQLPVVGASGTAKRPDSRTTDQCVADAFRKANEALRSSNATLG